VPILGTFPLRNELKPWNNEYNMAAGGTKMLSFSNFSDRCTQLTAQTDNQVPMQSHDRSKSGVHQRYLLSTRHANWSSERSKSGMVLVEYGKFIYNIIAKLFATRSLSRLELTEMQFLHVFPQLAVYLKQRRSLSFRQAFWA